MKLSSQKKRSSGRSLRRFQAALLALVIFLAAAPVWGAPGDVVWWEHSTLGASGDDAEAHAVVVKGSTAFVAGCKYDPTYKWFIKAYNTSKSYNSGTAVEKWQNSDQPLQAGDFGLDNIVVSGSRLFVSGHLLGGNLPLVRAYSTGKGKFLWEYPGDPNAVTYWAIPIAAKGNKVAMVVNETNNQAQVYCLSAQTGERLWKVPFGKGSGNNAAFVLAFTSSALVVAGNEYDSNGKEGWAVRAFNLKNGAEVGYDWHDMGDGDNTAYSIALSGSQIIVGGEGQQGGVNRGLVRVYDAKTLQYLWGDDFELKGSPYTEIYKLAVKGNFLVVGGDYQVGSNWPTFVRAYDLKTQKDLWTRDTEDIALGNGGDLKGIALTATEVCTGGVGFSSTIPSLWWVRAYDLSGNTLWTDPFDLGQGKNRAYDLAAAPKGFIGVGMAGTATTMEWVVRAYEP